VWEQAKSPLFPVATRARDYFASSADDKVDGRENARGRSGVLRVSIRDQVDTSAINLQRRPLPSLAPRLEIHLERRLGDDVALQIGKLFLANLILLRDIEMHDHIIRSVLCG